MGSFRDEAIVLVSRMRDLWPIEDDAREAGPLDALSPCVRAEVDDVRNQLVKYIKLLGYPDKASRRPSSNLSRTRRDLDDEDYHAVFWEGVTRGLRSTKPRISPEGEIDTNDPLYYLIFKGKCAILDYKRSTNLKKLTQKCHICGSQHKLFRPNPNTMSFDTTRAIEVRGYRDEDMDQLKEYRKRLVIDKLNRLPSSNICRECYFDGLRDWYPQARGGPAIPGSESYEEDLASISFMNICHDTDMMEVYVSGGSMNEDEPIDIIENTSSNYLGDEPSYFNEVEDNFDLVSLKKHIFINAPDGELVLHKLIFDIMYGESEIPCMVCHRRAKARVARGEKLSKIRLQIARILSKNPNLREEDIYLGDWDAKYESAMFCAGKPKDDCDNLAQRISDCFLFQPIKIREIIKQINNRHNAVRTIEGLIQEVLSEEAIRRKIRKR